MLAGSDTAIRPHNPSRSLHHAVSPRYPGFSLCFFLPLQASAESPDRVTPLIQQRPLLTLSGASVSSCSARMNLSRTISTTAIRKACACASQTLRTWQGTRCGFTRSCAARASLRGSAEPSSKSPSRETLEPPRGAPRRVDRVDRAKGYWPCSAPPRPSPSCPNRHRLFVVATRSLSTTWECS